MKARDLKYKVMRPLNIVFSNPATIASQFFEYFHAYWQAYHPDATEPLIIEFSDAPKPKCYINIKVIDVYTDWCIDRKIWEQFDLVLLNNAGESLEVHGEHWGHVLKAGNIFLLCGVLVFPGHDLFGKTICFNHNLTLFSDCVTRPFYPQYYDVRRSESVTDRSTMIYINGQNRVCRQYFMDCMAKIMSGRMPLKNSYDCIPTKLPDCDFESPEDTQFRQWLNDYYAVEDQQHEQEDLYYRNAISVGINNKFGPIPSGYFFLPEYFNHHCVIYPETSWINNSLFVTEKTWKCFVSGAIPWPVSGANFHAMLREMGFRTAIDLLPDELQAFDSILDHRERYMEQTQAIAWAFDHPEIWTGTRAELCRQINRERFYNTDWHLIGLQHFESILQRA